jgi:type II secretory ATPase GspE/PulE/Tfp pilus assembly ATPase PilB-like protein
MVLHGLGTDERTALSLVTVPMKLGKGSAYRSGVERRLLECLAGRGLISQIDVEAAMQEILSEEVNFETLIIQRYHVPKADLGAALSWLYHCPYMSYDERVAIDPDLMKDLSYDYLRRNYWVPLKREGTVLTVVIDNPRDVEKELDIRRAFPGFSIRLGVGLKCDIDRYLVAARDQLNGRSIKKLLGELVSEVGGDHSGEVKTKDIDENDSAIVRLTNQIIVEAYRLEASDVHIEPYAEKDTAVRFRVDGTCFTYTHIPAAYRRAIVSRLKIMANLDISERRKPQDGKIRYKLAKDRDIELRVATLPTAGSNEDVVLRLLTAKEPMSLEAMDFAPDVLRNVKELAERPYGIILCVGPTGSGKTTALHAVLKHINTDERKIWTAEDPIEITQEGLRQVQVHPKIGFTFAAAMRAFLRADPDVIMIGEMRDKETADTAIEASLTGHLVMSTLHTNSAVETVTRLLDMGCDSFNFADAMLGVLGMRLCKRLCSHCKEAYHPTSQEYDELIQGFGASYWDRLGISYTDDLTLFRGRGCETCNQSGFKGRVPVHELLLGTEEIKGLIQSKARATEILTVAMRDGMVTLLQNGIQKVLRGMTTYRQVRAVAMK